jgi:pimeloyl-ACP methyl ester carboxylesterase
VNQLTPQFPQFSPGIGERRGKVTFHRLKSKTRCEFFLYVPTSVGPNARLLVAVHGITRNAADQAFRFRALAEEHGVIVLAPLYEKKSFRQYQQLNGPRHQHSDRALLKMVDAVGKHVSCDAEKLHLFGFSGGGQFVHRFAMAHPERVSAVIMGAPGWFTLPDPELRYPLGLGKSSDLGKRVLSPERFLKIKFDVVVGTEDNLRDSSLRQSADLDARQGTTRIERGRRWVDAMNDAAESFGYMPRNSFRLLAGVNHSFATFFESSRLGAIVFESLGLERGALPDFSQRRFDGPGDVKTCETISLPDVSSRV